MLTQWALRHKFFKKVIGLILYQYRALLHADLIHATADSEVQDVRRIGLRNPIVLAPLGVRIPAAKSLVKSHRSLRHTVLFLSRVQRKKGLFNLVEAWSRIRREEWQLVIAGPSQEGHAEEILSRVKELGVEESVKIVGPVFGSKKDEIYASADIFVLPTFSENFGSVVIEALSFGLPVITTKGAPWRELEERKCGWWIEIGVKPLELALQEAMSLSVDERFDMGRRGLSLVREKYSWQSVAQRMLSAYEKLVQGCPK